MHTDAPRCKREHQAWHRVFGGGVGWTAPLWRGSPAQRVDAYQDTAPEGGNSIDPAHTGGVVKSLRQGPVLVALLFFAAWTAATWFFEANALAPLERLQGPLVTTVFLTAGVLGAGYAVLRRGGLVPAGDSGSA